MQTINISVTDEQKEYVDKLVRKEGFANRSELFRRLIRFIKSNPETIEEPKAVQLSPKAIKRYNKIADEIDSGKAKLFEAKTTKDLMEHLMK